MRAWILLAALISTALAGCADEGSTGDDVADDSFDSLNLEHDADTGIIRGVVIDEALRPLAGAKVVLGEGENAPETTSDDQGRFGFEALDPGTYTLDVSLLNFHPVKVNAEVEAGIPDPPVIKVALERLFEQAPYTEQFTLRGFMNCSYAAFVSSSCINDYTRIDPTGTCPGGCFPELANNANLDKREYIKPVQGGWQTMVFEMVWQPSAAATSEALGMTISFSERVGASHWYANGDGESPFRIQLNVGEEHSSQSGGEPTTVDPEGIPDLQVFTKTGQPGVAIQQDFELFQTDFIYGVAPEGWSLVAGDEVPY